MNLMKNNFELSNSITTYFKIYLLRHVYEALMYSYYLYCRFPRFLLSKYIESLRGN